MCVLLLLSALNSYAQHFRHEAGMWMGTQLSLDLPKRFNISTQYQLRLDRNLLRVRGSYFSATVQYEIVKKYLSAEIEYRYRTAPRGDQHRFGFGITGKYKYKKTTFSLRILYQRGHAYFNSSYEEGQEPTNYFRNRLQVKIDLKKRFEVGFSVEPYIRFSNKFNRVDRLRGMCSVGWEFIKSHHLQVFYLNQFTLNRRDPLMQHVCGVSYAMDIPKFWKTKKGKEKRKSKS